MNSRVFVSWDEEHQQNDKNVIQDHLLTFEGQKITVEVNKEQVALQIRKPLHLREEFNRMLSDEDDTDLKGCVEFNEMSTMRIEIPREALADECNMWWLLDQFNEIQSESRNDTKGNPCIASEKVVNDSLLYMDMGANESVPLSEESEHNTFRTVMKMQDENESTTNAESGVGWPETSQSSVSRTILRTEHSAEPYSEVCLSFAEDIDDQNKEIMESNEQQFNNNDSSKTNDESTLVIPTHDSLNVATVLSQIKMDNSELMKNKSIDEVAAIRRRLMECIVDNNVQQMIQIYKEALAVGILHGGCDSVFPEVFINLSSSIAVQYFIGFVNALRITTNGELLQADHENILSFGVKLILLCSQNAQSYDAFEVLMYLKDLGYEYQSNSCDSMSQKDFCCLLISICLNVQELDVAMDIIEKTSWFKDDDHVQIAQEKYTCLLTLMSELLRQFNIQFSQKLLIASVKTLHILMAHILGTQSADRVTAFYNRLMLIAIEKKVIAMCTELLALYETYGKLMHISFDVLHRLILFLAEQASDVSDYVPPLARAVLLAIDCKLYPKQNMFSSQTGGTIFVWKNMPLLDMFLVIYVHIRLLIDYMLEMQTVPPLGIRLCDMPQEPVLIEIFNTSTCSSELALANLKYTLQNCFPTKLEWTQRTSVFLQLRGDSLMHCIKNMATNIKTWKELIPMQFLLVKTVDNPLSEKFQPTDISYAKLPLDKPTNVQMQPAGKSECNIKPTNRIMQREQLNSVEYKDTFNSTETAESPIVKRSLLPTPETLLKHQQTIEESLPSRFSQLQSDGSLNLKYAARNTNSDQCMFNKQSQMEVISSGASLTCYRKPLSVERLPQAVVQPMISSKIAYDKDISHKYTDKIQRVSEINGNTKAEKMKEMKSNYRILNASTGKNLNNELTDPLLRTREFDKHAKSSFFTNSNSVSKHDLQLKTSKLLTHQSVLHSKPTKRSVINLNKYSSKNQNTLSADKDEKTSKHTDGTYLTSKSSWNAFSQHVEPLCESDMQHAVGTNSLQESISRSSNQRISTVVDELGSVERLSPWCQESPIEHTSLVQITSEYRNLQHAEGKINSRLHLNQQTGLQINQYASHQLTSLSTKSPNQFSVRYPDSQSSLSTALDTVAVRPLMPLKFVAPDVVSVPLQTLNPWSAESVEKVERNIDPQIPPVSFGYPRSLIRNEPLTKTVLGRSLTSSIENRSNSCRSDVKNPSTSQEQINQQIVSPELLVPFTSQPVSTKIIHQKNLQVQKFLSASRESSTFKSSALEQKVQEIPHSQFSKETSSVCIVDNNSDRQALSNCISNSCVIPSIRKCNNLTWRQQSPLKTHPNQAALRPSIKVAVQKSEASPPVCRQKPFSFPGSITLRSGSPGTSNNILVPISLGENTPRSGLCTGNMLMSNISDINTSAEELQSVVSDSPVRSAFGIRQTVFLPRPYAQPLHKFHPEPDRRSAYQIKKEAEAEASKKASQKLHVAKAESCIDNFKQIFSPNHYSKDRSYELASNFIEESETTTTPKGSWFELCRQEGNCISKAAFEVENYETPALKAFEENCHSNFHDNNSITYVSSDSIQTANEVHSMVYERLKFHIDKGNVLLADHMSFTNHLSVEICMKLGINNWSSHKLTPVDIRRIVNEVDLYFAT